MDVLNFPTLILVGKKMKKEFKIAVFEGDGIGPEIMAPTISILKQVADESTTYHLKFVKVAAGAQEYLKNGNALPDESLKIAKKSDAILLAAMGLPNIRYDDGTEISPQIDLRKELVLFAGVRPVRVIGGDHSPLKIPKGKVIDFVLIRESTEGLFYTQGKGEVFPNEARETLRITRAISEKLFRFSFSLAENRKKLGCGPGAVTCVDKANMFRAFAFFRDIFEQESKSYPDIKATSAYVDLMALWMVQKPWDLDVLVTENMFGDILSELGAGIMGGLGVAPSADIGLEHAVFQPCHGTAPDIAGQNLANPLAMILSGSMMLDWLGQKYKNNTLNLDAIKIRNAVDTVMLDKENLTSDLGGKASTTQTAEAVSRQLKLLN